MRCPACDAGMERTARGRVRFWSCPCGGHALTVPSLRRLLPPAMWCSVWPTMRAAATPGRRRCPDCRNPMDETAALEPVGGIRVDLCDGCQLVWLDPSEFQAAPKVALAPEMPLEQRQAIGKAMAAAFAVEYDARAELVFGPFEQLAKTLFLALLGPMARTFR